MIDHDYKKLGWAKTCQDGSPGLSVFDHCCHVGWVALELVNQSRNFPDDKLTPIAAAIIAAIYDVGKWSPGFLQKSALWLEKEKLSLIAKREDWEAQHLRFCSSYNIWRMTYSPVGMNRY